MLVEAHCSFLTDVRGTKEKRKKKNSTCTRFYQALNTSALNTST